MNLPSTSILTAAGAIAGAAILSACGIAATSEERTARAINCLERASFSDGMGRRGRDGRRGGRGRFNSDGCEEFARNWFVGRGGRGGGRGGGGGRGFSGLGPLFNEQSCAGCHQAGGASDLLIVQVSVPGTDAHGGPKAHPAYGGQIQDLAVRGVPAEARVRVNWRKKTGRYGDGTAYELEYPVVGFTGLAYGPLGDDAMISPRRVPTVFNTGAFDEVPARALEALADPDDADGDGISGRLNRVWDIDAERMTIGRYGWKAAAPSLEQQIATAFVMDMGIMSPFHRRETCTAVQTECRRARGSDLEISRGRIRTTARFSRRLVTEPGPARSAEGPRLFAEMKCAACHAPSLPTPDGPIAVYTDLLLHDLGEELSDGRPQFAASGSEWRTAPLAGLRRTLYQDRAGLLHDGRARSVAEAILWHGGEAEASREMFRTAPADVRAELVRFVENL